MVTTSVVAFGHCPNIASGLENHMRTKQFGRSDSERPQVWNFVESSADDVGDPQVFVLAAMFRRAHGTAPAIRTLARNGTFVGCDTRFELQGDGA